jgi:hypothetical protein
MDSRERACRRRQQVFTSCSGSCTCGSRRWTSGQSLFADFAILTKSEAYLHATPSQSVTSAVLSCSYGAAAAACAYEPVVCVKQGGGAGGTGGGRTAPAGRGAGAAQVRTADVVSRHDESAHLLSCSHPWQSRPCAQAAVPPPCLCTRHLACGVSTTDSCLLRSRNLGVRASLEAARSAASAAKSALDARCGGRFFKAPEP